MMLLKIHDSKGNDVAEAKAYEQLAELQHKMKSLKSKEVELQAKDPTVSEKSIKHKKILKDFLNQQRVYLTALSKPTAPSKPYTDGSISNLTYPSKRNGDDNFNDDCVPAFCRGINLQ